MAPGNPAHDIPPLCSQYIVAARQHRQPDASHGLIVNSGGNLCVYTPLTGATIPSQG